MFIGDTLYNREAIAWFTGLFEGEGSVGNYTIKGRPYQPSFGEKYRHKSYTRIQARIGMTDLDVLEQAQEVFDLGKIYGPYRVDTIRKPYYTLEYIGFEQVQAIFAAMYPLLRSRRREQFIKALNCKTFEEGEHDCYPEKDAV